MDQHVYSRIQVARTVGAIFVSGIPRKQPGLSGFIQREYKNHENLNHIYLLLNIWRAQLHCIVHNN